MREIKFRAWDGEKMLEPVDLSQNGKYWPEWFGGQDVELMQYTGLTDKNGAEIWEGDIVLCDVALSDERVKCTVRYNTCGFIANGMLYNAIHNSGAKTGEVIGNIYQHPELLCKSTT